MKKLIIISFCLLLIASMTIPAYAVTPSLKVPSITIPDISGSVKIGISENVFNEWIAGHPIDLNHSPWKVGMK